MEVNGQYQTGYEEPRTEDLMRYDDTGYLALLVGYIDYNNNLRMKLVRSFDENSETFAPKILGLINNRHTNAIQRLIQTIGSDNKLVLQDNGVLVEFPVFDDTVINTKFTNDSVISDIARQYAEYNYGDMPLCIESCIVYDMNTQDFKYTNEIDEDSVDLDLEFHHGFNTTNDKFYQDTWKGQALMFDDNFIDPNDTEQETEGYVHELLQTIRDEDVPKGMTKEEYIRYIIQNKLKEIENDYEPISNWAED